MTGLEILLLIVAIVVAAPFLVVGVFIVIAPLLGGPEDTRHVATCRSLNNIASAIIHRVRALRGADPEAGRCDPLPREGSCIVVSNHQGGADPTLISAVSPRWIHWLMAREYYSIFGLQWLFRGLGCVPVRRDGSDLGSLREGLRILKRGGVLGIFPQGGIRPEDEALDDRKSGAALFALRTGAPVVPLYIDGAPETENVFLALFIPSRTTIWAGEPIVFDTVRKPSREDLDSATDRIFGAIRTLKERADDVKQASTAS